MDGFFPRISKHEGSESGRSRSHDCSSVQVAFWGFIYCCPERIRVPRHLLCDTEHLRSHLSERQIQVAGGWCVVVTALVSGRDGVVR